VIIGHDWGSFTAGRFALWYPDKVMALIMYVLGNNVYAKPNAWAGQDECAIHTTVAKVHTDR
jgi:pimeloyl-ACP methyl ester carboxylesterase